MQCKEGWLYVKPRLGHWHTGYSDQILQNVASEQGLHCLLNFRLLRLNKTVLSPRSGPFSQPILRDSGPTKNQELSVVSLIVPPLILEICPKYLDTITL